MCGIVYVRGGKVCEEVLAQYSLQKSRGRRGFGYVSVGTKAIRKRFKDEAETFFNLSRVKSKEVIFHHRLPTSTDNEADYNHPIFSDQHHFNYYLIHNGIISNADELKKKHEELKLKYETEHMTDTKTSYGRRCEYKFNDSESLLHELALTIEGKKDDVECRGSVAFILLQTDKKGRPLRLFFGRDDGRPLKFLKTKDSFKLASELEGGEDIDESTLYIYSYAKDTMQTIKMEFTKTYWPATPAGQNFYNDNKSTFIGNDAFNKRLENLDMELNVIYKKRSLKGMKKFVNRLPRIRQGFGDLYHYQQQKWGQFVDDVNFFYEEIRHNRKR